MAFDYKSFISEIKTLIEEVSRFESADKKYNSDKFKKWRHKVEDFIYKVEAQTYSINCSINTRQFRIFGYGTYSSESQQQKFDADLTDSINELKLVVENYEKYGDPKEHTPVKKAETKELNWPDKVTLDWFFKHMPADMWWKLACAIVAALVLAYELGGYIQSHSISLPDNIQIKSK